MVSISIIIVNWNTKEFLKRCIDSVPAACGKLPYEVVVVDNASSDGSSAYLKEHYPDVVLISNSENYGFARACNQGAFRARGKYLFLLNPDTVLYQDCLVRLKDFSEQGSWVGIVGARLLDRKGRVQNSVRRFPTLGRLLLRDTVLGRVLPRYRKERLNRYLPLADAAKVDQVSGAAFLIKRELWRALGGMDNRFFMFYEEVDLCLRVKEMGYNVFYLPSASVTHLGGGSRHQARSEVFYYSCRSMFLYLEKHYPPAVVCLFKCIYKPLFLLELGLGVMLKPAERAKREFLRTRLGEFIWL